MFFTSSDHRFTQHSLAVFGHSSGRWDFSKFRKVKF